MPRKELSYLSIPCLVLDAILLVVKIGPRSHPSVKHIRVRLYHAVGTTVCEDRRIARDHVLVLVPARETDVRSL